MFSIFGIQGLSLHLPSIHFLPSSKLQMTLPAEDGKSAAVPDGFTRSLHCSLNLADEKPLKLTSEHVFSYITSTEFGFSSICTKDRLLAASRGWKKRLLCARHVSQDILKFQRNDSPYKSIRCVQMRILFVGGSAVYHQF